MIAIFRHELTRMRGQIIGWGASFALLSWFIVATYNSIVQSGDQIQKLYETYPKELVAFFGNAANLLTPGGYLDMGLLSYGLVVLGIFAVLGGSGLLAGDEETGRLDLLQAYPVSRTAMFFARLLALIIAILGILALTWAGCVLGLPGSHFEVSAGNLILPFLSMFAELTLYAGLALWLSMVLPSRSKAAMTAGLLMVASYFITSLSHVGDSLKDFARFSPFNYYQSGYAVEGLNLGWFFGLLGLAVLFILAAWWSYVRRDLRVSGEGSWRWSFAFRKKPTST
jgi:ABC-2 type transport system permease protein